MKVLLSACAFTLLASSAGANPITLGTWSPAPAAGNTGTPFFHGDSWDCPTCGAAWSLPSGAEYLHEAADPSRPAAFTWEGWEGGTDLGGTSAYLGDHSFAYNAVSGEFLLDNGHGYTSRSGIAASVLLARLRAPLITTYWLWFEDLPIGWTDADYNDRGFTWTVATTSSVPEDPLPTPEPGTLTLIGLGLAGVARSVRRRRRAASL